MDNNNAYTERLRIGPVTQERIREICLRLHLKDPTAKRNLEVCLGHIEADLNNYAQTSPARSRRKDIIASRADLLSAFDAMLEVIERNADDLSESLPIASLEAIGLLLAPDAAQDILKEKTPTYLNADSDASSRRAVGVQFGHILLPETIRRIRQPLSDWMAEHVDKGGRPPDLRRKFIIRTLARHAPEIIGEEATATAKSTFMELCTAVCQEFGLPDKGIEDAVERELRELSSAAREKTGAG